MAKRKRFDATLEGMGGGARLSSGDGLRRMDEKEITNGVMDYACPLNLLQLL